MTAARALSEPPGVLQEFHDRTSRSRDAYTRAKSRLPGGVNRNITYFAPHPVFFERGVGAGLFDIDGNKYCDFLGNYTAMILGHSNAEVAAAVRAQVLRGTTWGGATTTEFELADLIADRIPSMEMTRFTSSGTEATMMALRAARAATGRRLIAKFEGGYHGLHDYATVSLEPLLEQAGPRERPASVAPRGVPRDVADTVVVLPFNDADAVDAILAVHGPDLAAMIVEPVMGVAGVIEPRHDFLATLRSEADRHGIVLIFDEVISFRTAYGAAQSVYGVKPDLTTLGKVIGGGFPIGAVGGDPRIMEVFNPSARNSVTLSGTFHANPVAMQAGIATLEALDAKVLGRLNADAERFLREVRVVLATSSRPVQLNAVGSLFNIHFSPSPVTDYRTSLCSDKGALRWLHLALLNEGILLAPRGLGCLSVPMTHGDLNRFVDGLDRALTKLNGHD